MHHHPVVIVKHPDSPGQRYDKLKNFPSRQICEGAVDALQLLETQPAHVVIAEMDLPDMTGIELAEAIRDIDSENGHFTYIILYGHELCEDMQTAYEKSIDVFVSDTDPQILELSVQAGARISERVNLLAEQNAKLVEERQELLLGQLLDPLTGLGNRRLAEQTLNDAVRHVEARGGAVCFLMITVNNYADLLSSYDEKIANELIVAVSERIENLVRPMDVTTYFAPATFGLVLVQPSINQCTAECYQRIFDGVRLKSYKTSVGFQSANIAMSICASHAETGAPDPEKMISVAAANLEIASTKQSIIVEHLADQING